MRFQEIKQAIVDTLGAAAAGRFEVIGYQRKTKSADTISSNRLVQVYYSGGQLPESKGKYIGNKNHDMVFNIDLTVSESAKADLATLTNPGSTDAQRATALAGIQYASDKADSQIDDLIEIIFQILLDAQNVDLGLTKGTFGSRWIPEIVKDATLDEGGFAIKTAQLKYTCQSDEIVSGDPGTTPSSVIYDTTVDLDGDDVEKTGVTVNNT